MRARGHGFLRRWRTPLGWYLKSLRSYARFAGRARRREFWIFALVSAFLSFLLTTADAVLAAGSNAGYGPLSLAYWAVILLPALAVAVRRLHDSGRSGRWLLLLAVPILGWAVLCLFWVAESEEGPNRYGPDPKAPRPEPGGDGPPREPRLYGELASWWPLLSAPEDYAEEAAFYARLLRDACSSPPASLLELGSGGGNNALHMKASFRSVTLVDPAPGMLEVSRALNPECEHVRGDMRSARLDREFDCVFIHDAVGYITTLADLARTCETAFVHCRRGGAVVLAPDHVKETFRPSTSHGGHDSGERGLRYVQWTRDPDPDDSAYVMDFAFLLREGDSVRVEHDRHVGGLFARADWLRVVHEAGFDAEAVPFLHSEVDRPVDVFVGRKPVPE